MHTYNLSRCIRIRFSFHCALVHDQGLLFFGYMSLVSFAFFVMTGTFGFAACYLFVHKIYSSIKVD